MQISEILKYADKIFSEEGLQINGFSIQCGSGLSIKIEKLESGIHVYFPGEVKPQVEVNKIVTFSLTLLGIYFYENSGVLELDNFPDIPFKYDQLT